MKRRIKRILTSALTVILCVVLNINPLGVIAKEVYDSGIFEDFYWFNYNLGRLAYGNISVVHARTIYNTYYQTGRYGNRFSVSIDCGDPVNGEFPVTLVVKELPSDPNTPSLDTDLKHTFNISVASITSPKDFYSIVSSQMPTIRNLIDTNFVSASTDGLDAHIQEQLTDNISIAAKSAFSQVSQVEQDIVSTKNTTVKDRIATMSPKLAANTYVYDRANYEVYIIDSTGNPQPVPRSTAAELKALDGSKLPDREVLNVYCVSPSVGWVEKGESSENPDKYNENVNRFDPMSGDSSGVDGGHASASNQVAQLNAENSIAQSAVEINEKLAQIGNDVYSIKQTVDEMNDTLSNIDKEVFEIAKSMHHYRVANVYSLNNMFNTAYRPTTDELPFLADFVMVNGAFANVYTGTWDANIKTTYNNATANTRALQVLGQDAIVRSEGMRSIPKILINENAKTETHYGEDLGANGNSGANVQSQFYPNVSKEDLDSWNAIDAEAKRLLYGHSPMDRSVIPSTENIVYSVEYIPQENVTYLDAVTVLYKALGQDVFTYQSFFTRDNTIKPETSPLSQGLSGVQEFEGYSYYLFTTRNNVQYSRGQIPNQYMYSEEDKYENQQDPANLTYTYNVYWEKACRDGVVSYDTKDNVINQYEFYIIAAKLMQLYGEPEMRQDEINALLQVYGDYYPVQLGELVADSWAYLAARGIFPEEWYEEKEGSNHVINTLSRNDLLDICMRIKDKDSRTDYKSIQISLDLADVLQDDGYYPVWKQKWQANRTESHLTVDYAQFEYNDYLIAIPDNSGIDMNGFPFIYNSDEYEDADAAPISIAIYSGVVQVDGRSFWHIQVDDKCDKDLYLAFATYKDGKMILTENTTFLRIPCSNDESEHPLRGGFYTSFVWNGHTLEVEYSTSTDGTDGDWARGAQQSFKIKDGDDNFVQYCDTLRRTTNEMALQTGDDVNELTEASAKGLFWFMDTQTDILPHEKLGNWFIEMTKPMTALAAPINDPDRNTSQVVLSITQKQETGTGSNNKVNTAYINSIVTTDNKIYNINTLKEGDTRTDLKGNKWKYIGNDEWQIQVTGKFSYITHNGEQYDAAEHDGEIVMDDDDHHYYKSENGYWVYSAQATTSSPSPASSLTAGNDVFIEVSNNVALKASFGPCHDDGTPLDKSETAAGMGSQWAWASSTGWRPIGQTVYVYYTQYLKDYIVTDVNGIRYKRDVNCWTYVDIDDDNDSGDGISSTPGVDASTATFLKTQGKFSIKIEGLQKAADIAGIPLLVDGSDLYINTSAIGTELSRLDLLLDHGSNMTGEYLGESWTTNYTQILYGTKKEKYDKPGNYCARFALGSYFDGTSLESKINVDETAARILWNAYDGSDYNALINILRMYNPINGTTRLREITQSEHNGYITYEIVCSDMKTAREVAGAVAGIANAQTGKDVYDEAADLWTKHKVDVNSDTIMSRDQQLMVRFSSMYDAGFAWGTKLSQTDKPHYDEATGTYSFMTMNGEVLVNDQAHFIQVGTMLYTFTGDYAPNLVYVPNDNNTVADDSSLKDYYFDVRTILGLTNQSFECYSGKSIIDNLNCVGVSGSAEYSLNTNTNTFTSSSMFGTSPSSLAVWPDIPALQNTTSDVVTYGVNNVEHTMYDNTGGYNPTTARMIINNFNPAANYILVANDTGDEQVQNISARLYVYYLRDAFEGILDEDSDAVRDGKKLKASINSRWKDHYVELYKEHRAEFLTSPYNSTANTLNSVFKQYTKGRGSEGSTEGYNSVDDIMSHSTDADILDVMTALALYDLYAATGSVYIAPEYCVREFDVSYNYVTNHISENLAEEPPDIITPANLDMITDPEPPNDAGCIYWVSGIGFVYNVPTIEDFTLEDYLMGKYPLPIASISNTDFIMINPNYYKTASDGATGVADIPYGWELTSDGFQHYKSMFEKASAGSTSSNSKVVKINVPKKGTTSTHVPPFDIDGVELAPTAVYARYGIWRQAELETIHTDSISAPLSKSDIFYYGCRRIFVNASEPALGNSLPIYYGVDVAYESVHLPNNYYAYIAGSMPTSTFYKSTYRNIYIIPPGDFIEGTGIDATNIKQTDLVTDVIMDNTASAKLRYILNMVDKSTSWIMYVVFTLAPMLCIILMTILIGMSFLTENKLWLLFCNKCFDPVKILTFGMRDSTDWTWRKVLIPCIITYVSFCLFANANILRIIIWMIDAWVRFTSYIR